MIKTLKHLSYELKVELSELEHIVSHLDSFYYQKEEVKLDSNKQPKIKHGVIQKRILNPSIKRLKIIQKRLVKNILQKLDIPEYAYGGIKQRDNILNAKKHQGKKFIFTTDLKDFFPSISNKKVYEMFISFSFSPTVARILTKLTTYKGRLPQGAPTSPILANLVFIKTGKDLQAFSKEHNLVFTTFVDDLTFSSTKDFKNEAQAILERIVADGYKISHNKTNYKTKLPVVTGLVVKNNNIDLTDALKNKLKATENKTEDQIAGLQRYADRVKAANIRKK